MGYPRSHHVTPGFPGTYHCYSRCVRRAFLCGRDRRSGRNFEHRRRWLEQRLEALANAFAVDVLAFAILENHFHLVVHVEPAMPWQWSDRDVVERWLSVSRRRFPSDELRRQHIDALLLDTAALRKLRTKLGSLSDFMAMLKEPIARRANAEDECSGRFWEGRFKAQALLDEMAVLGCMAYVDLNPIRAGLTSAAHDAAYTSARRRHREHAPQAPLAPVFGPDRCPMPAMTEADYLALLAWTAEHSGYRLRPQSVTKTPQPVRAPPALHTLRLSDRAWSQHVNATETGYARAIGSPDALTAHARRLGQRWLCGISLARRLEQLSTQKVRGVAC